MASVASHTIIREDLEQEQQELAEIIDRIHHQYRSGSSQMYDPHVDSAGPPPTDQDVSLFLVRVKVRSDIRQCIVTRNLCSQTGAEQRIVATVGERLLQSTSSTYSVSSIFAVPSSPGCIFCEGSSPAAVSLALRGFSDIYIGTLCLVPVLERMSLLTMAPATGDLIKDGDWVRIRSGLYRSDLAIVMRATSEDLEIGLIPRIPLTMGLSQRQKPEAKPFDVEFVRAVYGKDSVVKRIDGYTFRRALFKGGLLYRKVSPNVVQGASPRTAQELSHFLKISLTGNFQLLSEAVSAAMAQMNASFDLKCGDRVEVIRGEQAGLQGFVVIVSPQAVVVDFRKLDTELGSVQVPLPDVVPRYHVGDHVEVRKGWRHEGRRGIVTAIVDDEVSFTEFVTHQLVCLSIITGEFFAERSCARYIQDE